MFVVMIGHTIFTVLTGERQQSVTFSYEENSLIPFTVQPILTLGTQPHRIFMVAIH